MLITADYKINFTPEKSEQIPELHTRAASGASWPEQRDSTTRLPRQTPPYSALPQPMQPTHPRTMFLGAAARCSLPYRRYEHIAPPTGCAVRLSARPAAPLHPLPHVHRARTSCQMGHRYLDDRTAPAAVEQRCAHVEGSRMLRGLLFLDQ